MDGAEDEMKGRDGRGGGRATGDVEIEEPEGRRRIKKNVPAAAKLGKKSFEGGRGGERDWEPIGTPPLEKKRGQGVATGFGDAPFWGRFLLRGEP